jgi:hypothetical protein
MGGVSGGWEEGERRGGRWEGGATRSFLPTVLGLSQLLGPQQALNPLVGMFRTLFPPQYQLPYLARLPSLHMFTAHTVST